MKKSTEKTQPAVVAGEGDILKPLKDLAAKYAARARYLALLGKGEKFYQDAARNVESMIAAA